jgi:hypothetical protein
MCGVVSAYSVWDATGPGVPALLGKRAAGAIRRENWRMLELSRLTPHLPPELRTEALGMLAAIGREQWRAAGLAFIAPHLSAGQLTEAVAVADAIQDAYWQAAAMAGLAWHLPPAVRIRAVAALTIVTTA